MDYMQSDPGRTGQLPEGFQLVRELTRDRSRAVYLATDLVRGGQVTLTALGWLGDPVGLAKIAREMDAVTGLHITAPHVAATVWPTSDDLARVPAALRGDCDLTEADPRLPDARRLLQCTDGEGQNALVAMFEGGPAADAAYQGVAASDPALRRGEGDCAHSTGFEHRYPGVGDFRGRVLCDRVGTAARLAWIDQPNRTVAVAERSDGNAAELYRSWSRWVEQPAFPSQEEQQLLDVLPEDTCQRARPVPWTAWTG